MSSKTAIVPASVRTRIHAQIDALLDRLKVCPACGKAFIDQSKTRSRRWCSMSGCGNRAKVAAHRERRTKAERVRAYPDSETKNE